MIKTYSHIIKLYIPCVQFLIQDQGWGRPYRHDVGIVRTNIVVNLQTCGGLLGHCLQNHPS